MDDNSWSKLDKLGCATYLLLLASFIVGTIYLMFFAEKIQMLAEFSIFYFILTMLGILHLYDIYYKIAEWIFYPETSSEKLIRNKRQEYKKMYPIKIARMKITKLRKELEIKDMNNELKNIRNKITQEDKK